MRLFLKNKNGYITLLVVVIISLLLLLALYFIDYILNDTKISQSHKLATKTYYLAEAGINEAIWKLSHDVTWTNNFTNNPTWQGSITRTAIFEPNDSYTVTVQNYDLAKAEITATAHITSPGQNAQRVVKTKVYKAMTPLLTQNISLYGSANIKLQAASVTIDASNIYSSDDIILNFFSVLTVNGEINALGNVNKSWTSTINATAIHASNYPPPPAIVIEMPQIDFDSANPTSYLNMADQVYTQQQFQQLLNNSSVTLNGITYVTGSVNVPKGVNLTINGVLVCDDNFKIGVSAWPLWQPNPNLTVNKIGNEPAGILSKKNITFGSFVSSAVINGLIYASNNLKINNLSTPFTVNGGLIAYDLDFSSLWQPTTIHYDQDVVIHTLGGYGFSPIINIEHWEEEY